MDYIVLKGYDYRCIVDALRFLIEVIEKNEDCEYDAFEFDETKKVLKRSEVWKNVWKDQ